MNGFLYRKIAALVLTVLSAAAHSANLCANVQPPAAYLTMRRTLDQQIETFANSKLIATQSDAVLSKLLAAKSPVITQWFKQHDLNDKPVETVVKQWRSYYANNFVLIKYPAGDSKIDAAIETLVDTALKANLTPTVETRFGTLFKKSQTQAVHTLERLAPANSAGSAAPTNSAAIANRLSQIKLYWPTQLKSARNNAVPLDLINWGIAYDPVPNQINVGLNALAYSTDETIVAVFAHELGHAFDSCRWGAFFKGPWPFDSVGTCLRSTASIGAKKRDDSAIDQEVSAKHLSRELALSLKQNPTCNKTLYPPIGLQADQLPESFADWFSAEVMSDLATGSKTFAIVNLRQDLCEDTSLVPGSSYPSNHDRLERLYSVQPKIQAALAAASVPPQAAPATYCPMKP